MRAPNRGHGRQRVHEIAERSEADDEDARSVTGSSFGRRTSTFGQVAPSDVLRRVILRIADDRDAAAVGADRLALRHGIDRVVRALAVHVRLESRQQALDGRLAETARRSRRRAARRPVPRARRPACIGRPSPFQRPHRLIVVDRDDQAIGLRARRPRDSARDRRGECRNSRWRTRSCGRRGDRAATSAASSASRDDLSHGSCAGLTAHARPADAARAPVRD